jgi:hypothetical protein
MVMGMNGGGGWRLAEVLLEFVDVVAVAVAVNGSAAKASGGNGVGEAGAAASSSAACRACLLSLLFGGESTRDRGVWKSLLVLGEARPMLGMSWSWPPWSSSSAEAEVEEKEWKSSEATLGCGEELWRSLESETGAARRWRLADILCLWCHAWWMHGLS